MSAGAEPVTDYLDVTLLGKSYRIACPQAEQAGLEAAVAYLQEKMAEITENTKKILEVILNLKEGEVMSYRDVAHLAGLSNGARQVSRVLHSMSKKYGLPWWRVVRSDRTIGLPEPAKSEQMELLKKEGVSFTAQGKIVIEDELL